MTRSPTASPKHLKSLRGGALGALAFHRKERRTLARASKAMGALIPARVRCPLTARVRCLLRRRGLKRRSFKDSRRVPTRAITRHLPGHKPFASPPTILRTISMPPRLGCVKSIESKAKVRESIRVIRPDALALQEVGSVETLMELRASLKAEGSDFPHSGMSPDLCGPACGGFRSRRAIRTPTTVSSLTASDGSGEGFRGGRAGESRLRIHAFRRGP